MSDLLPTQKAPRVVQKTGKVKAADLQSQEALLVVTAAKPAAAIWQALPAANQLRKIVKNRNIKDLAAQTRLDNKSATAVYLAALPGSGNGNKAVTSFALLSFAGKLVATALKDNPASVAILVAGFGSAPAGQIVRALVAALTAHGFRLPSYKTGAEKTSRLRSIRILGLGERVDLGRTAAAAQATNLARWLTALPPNKLDTRSYRTAIGQLSKRYDWKLEFLDEKKLNRLGAGAFLAVSRGNSTRDAGIVHLRYRPNKKTAPPALALVGKGIIFDTGGTNLKPFKAMLDMHHDMAGSAVALATLVALSELQAPFAVDCWLAITENRLSNDAYKSRDIVTACNGTSIEVIHTDAEGRMALADTLALAGREEPEAIIDFATLTGTCVAAVTERYSGAFSNREMLNEVIIQAGENSGERVWPFPLDPDFDEDIASEVADVMQCAPAGGGDHIQAAKFLQRFVPKSSAWIHVDLSAASRKGGLADIPTTVTGFGVRFALSLALDHLDQLQAAAKT